MTEDEYMKKNKLDYCMLCGGHYAKIKDNKRYERSVALPVRFYRELKRRMKDKTRETTLRFSLTSVPVKEKVTK